MVILYKNTIMNILLSGGGKGKEVEEIDNFFIKKAKNKKVLYIPLAMDKYSYDECEEWFRDTYSNYGVKDFLTCTNLYNCDLDDFEAVYIGGGNTFKLLKLINESGFRKKLIDFAYSDGLIYGGSAGAIILGKDISTALHSDDNYVMLEETRGLNLLDNYSIWCHYKVESDKELIEHTKENLLILYEESGIYFDGNIFIPIGKQYKKEYND